MNHRRIAGALVVAAAVGYVAFSFLRGAAETAKFTRENACRALAPDPVAPALAAGHAPDFSLPDPNGKTWSLAGLRGTPVLLNFWATWCPPCRSEMPAMQELYTSMPADKFKMLAILVNDEPSTADRVAAKSGCTFPILVDPENKTVKKYKVIGIPQTFIVDKK